MCLGLGSPCGSSFCFPRCSFVLGRHLGLGPPRSGRRDKNLNESYLLWKPSQKMLGGASGKGDGKRKAAREGSIVQGQLGLHPPGPLGHCVGHAPQSPVTGGARGMGCSPPDPHKAGVLGCSPGVLDLGLAQTPLHTGPLPVPPPTRGPFWKPASL